MTTGHDIKAAKWAFNTHCAEHKCKPRECDLRRRLWLAYMWVAGQWGK